MKRFFSYLMVMATLVLGGGKAMAQSVTIGGVIYTVSGDHAYVSGNDGTVTDVIIPDVVNISGQDYPVTEIGTNAFMYCSSMTSLVLPENLTSIASCALYECTSLTELRIPSKVTSIGWNALVGMKSLKLIELNFEYIPGMEVLFSDMEGRAIDLICHSTVVPEILCTGEYSPNSHGGGGLVPINTILYVPKGCYDAYREKYPNHKIADIVDGEDFELEIFTEDGIRYANDCAVEVIDKSLVEYTLKDDTRILASELFKDCSSLKALDIPETVRIIGASAFYNCSSLISVNMPSGITSIGSNTFYGCVALDSIVLPETVTTIDDNAFYNCSSLTSINIPLGVISIGDYAFSNCSSLSSLALPETVTSIGLRAFNMCSSLDSINIPFGVPLIDEWTFCGCSSLTSLILPETVTAIKHRAFYACAKLNTIILPKKLTNIESYAFQDCKKLRRIMNFSDLQLTIGSTDYGYVATYAWQVINVDTIIDGYWFDTDSNGKHHLTYYEGTDSILILPTDYQGGNYCINGTAFSGHNEIISIQLPEAVDSVGAGAFEGCSSLTSINIPSGVSSIGNNTFAGCSSLTSLILPETVISIGESTFYNCTALTSLALPETVASIGAQAFYNCSSLTSVNIPLGVSSIGDNTFYGCSALTDIIIPASITSIGNHAFEGCTGLKELTIADGNELLHLGHNNTSYGGQFTSCCLDKLYLGRNLSWDYGHSPFNGITTLKEVIVGDCVTAIGVNLFYNCSSLESIHLSENITSIGGSAFSDCGALTYIHCGFESPEILYGKGLREQAAIYVPEGTYVAYKELFPNNTIIDGEVNEVTIDITVPGTLGEEVLSQVAYIRDVNSLKVSGTLNDDDLATITGSMVNLLHLDLSKTNLTSVSGVGQANLCSIVFPDSCKAISGYGNHDNLISITLPDAVETLDGNCFYSCDQLTEVTIPANLKTVGANAFYDCRKLKDIAFNDGLECVGDYAFCGCYNLKSVTFGAGVKSIGREAFRYCQALNYVSLGEDAVSLGFWAFFWCQNLETIIAGKGFSSTSSYAFEGCPNITEIHIPNIESWLTYDFGSVTDSYFYYSIPNNASSKSNLYIDGELVTDVVIPSSVTSIRPYAFYQIKGITSVTIPEGVTNIGSYAFAGCDSLRSITIPSTLTYCGGGAFNGLTEVTCPAFFPPITGGDLIGANNCTLYVPEWTLNRYKLANNWNLFASIEPISDIYPNSISVYTEESLTIPAEGLAADYKPNMEIVRYDNSNIGRFTVRGEGTLPLTSFKMQQTRDANTMTSLVNYGTLTADNVVTDLNISTNTWHFLTFPYDVKVSDIATVGNWVISRYDGAARAKEDFGNTWKTLPYDSILHAGEGYIWHSQGGSFTVPAIDNENKNLIFANDTRYIQLKENPAATDANYGWNLIGNPYPCFYDTRFMDFTSPITVRSGNSYAAYSPVDDSYILSPLEAFFVQCSAESNVVGFYTEGRQTDNTVRTLTSAPTTRTANERSVLNLYLENGNYADHTRLVVNEGASLVYEIACDAAKFMSDDAAVQQLFTIESDERMAINERPLANGKAALGVYIGKAGSYTLSLDTKAMDTEVLLVDKLLGTETDLANGSYAFTAEAGTFTDRFEIRMKRTGVVDGIEAVAAELKVEATADGISVSNATTPIYIYNATGALIDIKTGNAVTFDVPQGVYVVKVGDNVHKVVVK